MGTDVDGAVPEIAEDDLGRAMESIWSGDSPGERLRADHLRTALSGRRRLDELATECLRTANGGASDARPGPLPGFATTPRLYRALEAEVDSCASSCRRARTVDELRRGVAALLSTVPPDHCVPLELLMPEGLPQDVADQCAALALVDEGAAAKALGDAIVAFEVAVIGEDARVPALTVVCPPGEDPQSGPAATPSSHHGRADAAAERAKRRRLATFRAELEEAFSRSDRSLSHTDAGQHAAFAFRAAATLLEVSGAAAEAALRALMGGGGDQRGDAPPAERISVSRVMTKRRAFVAVRVGVGAWSDEHYGLGAGLTITHALRASIGPADTVRILVKHTIPLAPRGCDLRSAAEDAFLDADAEERGDGSGLDDGAASGLPLVTSAVGLPRSAFAFEMLDGDGEGEPDGVDGESPLAELLLLEEMDGGDEPNADGRFGGGDCPLTCEVWSWGENEAGCLGLGLGRDSGGATPRKVRWPVDGALPAEAVAAVACSARHTLLVTTFGGLFSCGDGADGALGTGAMQSTGTFVPVSWSAVTDQPAAAKRSAADAPGRTPHPTIVRVACGCDVLGAHSTAIDDSGRLYTWGKGAATGLGVTGPVLSPRDATKLVEEAAIVADAAYVNWDRREGSWRAELKRERSADRRRRAQRVALSARTVSVACGGMFTLLATASGLAVAFGSFSHGRLGFAPEAAYADGAPQRRAAAADRRGRRPRFQLRPRAVEGLAGRRVVMVAAGDAHALALDETGRVFGWGRNDAGQAGTAGTGPDGALAAAVTAPAAVPPFDRLGGTRAASIACGFDHSAAIDAGGRVWTWGSRGGACLGHGEDFEGAARRAGRLVRDERGRSGAEKAESAAMAGAIPLRIRSSGKDTYARTGQVPPDAFAWARPRIVEALAGAQVVDAALGERVTALRLEDRAMYVCGDDSPVLRESVSVPRLLCAQKCAADIADARVVSIACGGRRVLACTAGDRLTDSLGGTLWRAAQKRAASREVLSEGSEAERGSDSDVGGMEPDCDVVVAGRVLHAHKVILAHRSRVLRDLILAEEARGSSKEHAERGVSAAAAVAAAAAGSRRVQIFLPGLKREVAHHLLHFVYCDTLPADFAARALTSLPLDLKDAARAFALPRLAALCDTVALMADPHMLDDASSNAARGAAVSGDGADPSSGDEEAGTPAGPLLPRSTFALDIGAAVADGAWADVILLAEGRSIFAHAAVLSTRSEYFRGIFGGGLRERLQGQWPSSPLEVELPSSYAGVLRMLGYVYAGALPSGPADVLLDDLLNADRYGVRGLRELVESMIDVRTENVCAVLRVTSQVPAARRLREDALRVAVGNLGVVAAQGEFFPLADGADVLLRADILSRAARVSEPGHRAIFDFVGTGAADGGRAGSNHLEAEKHAREQIPWLATAGAALLIACAKPVLLLIQALPVPRAIFPFLNAAACFLLLRALFNRTIQ